MPLLHINLSKLLKFANTSPNGTPLNMTFMGPALVEFYKQLNEQIQIFVTDSLGGTISADEIQKSPAYRAVIPEAYLTEYLKNARDANATQLNLYININLPNIFCILIDNGSGFKEFLDTEDRRKAINPKTGCTDFRKIIDPTFDASVGILKAGKAIKSHKAKIRETIKLKIEIGEIEEKEVKEALAKSPTGGQGMGLSGITKLMHRVTNGIGTMEIADASELKLDNKSEFGITARDIPEHGSIIALESPLYSKAWYEQFIIDQKKLLRQFRNEQLVPELPLLSYPDQTAELRFLTEIGAIPSLWRRTREWEQEGFAKETKSIDLSAFKQKKVEEVIDELKADLRIAEEQLAALQRSENVSEYNIRVAIRAVEQCQNRLSDAEAELNENTQTHVVHKGLSIFSDQEDEDTEVKQDNPASSPTERQSATSPLAAYNLHARNISVSSLSSKSSVEPLSSPSASGSDAPEPSPLSAVTPQSINSPRNRQ